MNPVSASKDSTPIQIIQVSNINMSAIQMIISNIKSLSEEERCQVLAAFLFEPVEAKEKKPRANTGKPTPHGDFTRKILAEHKDEVALFKVANPEMKGSHLVFVANYKKEHEGEFASFKAQWDIEHPTEAPVKAKKVSPKDTKAKKSVDAPVPVQEKVEVIVEPVTEQKKRGPKRLAEMTPEELAIHNARKAERKVKKESGSGATTPERADSPPKIKVA